MEIEQQPSLQSTAATAPCHTNVDFFPISAAEAMNPSRRSTMEDVHSILRPGTWNESIPHTSKYMRQQLIYESSLWIIVLTMR